MMLPIPGQNEKAEASALAPARLPVFKKRLPVMPVLTLKPGREKSLKRHHPWIFSGAIARVDGEPQAGDTVEVRAADGGFLALAAYSPASQIRARVWRWTPGPVDEAFFTTTVFAAAGRRETLAAAADCNAQRLIHGESDGLPGVVADRFGDHVVVQLLAAGAERWRDAIGAALLALPGVRGVSERSDADVRELEGLAARNAHLCGEAPSGPLPVVEHGLHYAIDAGAGHKTGFYLDQRDNRLLLRHLSAGRTVLDAFCYQGGFALNALAGGASAVTAIDSSAPALTIARTNATRNGLAGVDWREADVFQLLRQFRNEGRRFDMIVLDPPKLAPTAAHVEKAARAYKDANLLGFKLLNPGGRLMTFSCSGGVSADLFQKIVAGAALDAGVDARIEAWLHAAPDHPVALHFPEGEYLKGLLLRAG
jgi:23S rRNA (cytosine1962-C5)-methyltransferase